MSPTVRRWVAVVTVAVALLCSAGSCGSKLDDVVTAIARSQQVDDTVVRQALAREATGEADQLALAQKWRDELPTQPLPNLNAQVSVWDDLAEELLEQLRSAVCGALLDIVATGQVPDGATFVQQYLASLALPNEQVLEIAVAFQGLFDSAVAGELTTLQVRFTLLELQYC